MSARRPMVNSGPVGRAVSCIHMRAVKDVAVGDKVRSVNKNESTADRRDAKKNTATLQPNFLDDGGEFWLLVFRWWLLVLQVMAMTRNDDDDNNK